MRPLVLTRSVVWILAVGACDARSPEPGVTPTSRAPAPRPRECKELPVELPVGAVVDYSRDDYEHNVIHDYAFVVDAPCPESVLAVLPEPECVRFARPALQLVWTRLRELEVHRIEMTDRDGQCAHCGGPWITVQWPDGECSVGTGFETEITDATQARYYDVARYLDGISERVAAKLRKSSAVE